MPALEYDISFGTRVGVVASPLVVGHMWASSNRYLSNTNINTNTTFFYPQIGTGSFLGQGNYVTSRVNSIEPCRRTLVYYIQNSQCLAKDTRHSANLAIRCYHRCVGRRGRKSRKSTNRIDDIDMENFDNLGEGWRIATGKVKNLENGPHKTTTRLS